MARGTSIAAETGARWRPDADDLGALLLVLAALAVVPWRLIGARPASPASGLALLAAGVVAGALLWRGCRRTGDTRQARALRLLALGFGAVWLGHALRLALAPTGLDPRSAAVFAEAAASVLFLVGALALPHGPSLQRGPWLDAAAALVAGGMLFDVVGSGDTARLSALLVLVVPAVSVGLLLARDEPPSRPTLGLLAAGILLVGLGHAASERRAAHESLGAPDAAFMLSWVAVGLAGRLQRGGDDHSPVAAGAALPRVPWATYAAAAAGFGALVATALQGRPSPGQAGAAAALAAVALLRQHAFARDRARLAAESSAAQVRARFDVLVGSAADVLALLDAAGRFQYVSPPVVRVLGLAPETLVGVEAFALMHPDDVAGARQALAACIDAPGILQHASLRFRHADGSWRDIEADGINYLDDVRIGAVSVTFRDVTGRRKAQDELRAQKDLLANLLAVARATAQSPGLEVTLRNTLTVMKRLVDAEGGSIFLVDERGAVHTSLFAEGDPLPEALRRSHASRMLRDGLAGWVARRREPAVVAEVGADPRWIPVAEEAVRSALSVPILFGDVLVGVLSLTDSRPAHFGSAALRFVQGACEQIALALRNAQVFEALGRMAHRQRLLNEFVRAAGLRLDPDAMVEAALSTIARKTHWVNVALAVPDPETRFLRIRATPEGRMPERPPRTDEGVVGRAFTSGRVQRVPDVRVDPDYVAASPEVRSELAVPLKRGGRVLGVLNLESEELDGFDDEDLLLAEGLADTVALAMDDAATYRRLADESERLQAVIRASRDGMVLLDADARIRLVNPPALRLLGLGGEPQEWLGRHALDVPRLRGIETAAGDIDWDGRAVRALSQPVATGGAEGRLIVLRDVSEDRRIEALREDLTHTLVHDLRAPLNSIVWILEVLGQAPCIDGSHRELLDVAGRATQRLVALVDTILDVGRLEQGRMPLAREAVALAQVVADVLDMHAPACQQRGVALRSEVDLDLPRADADPGLLRRVLENLVANAVRHTPRGGEVRVVATPTSDGAALELRVSDTGQGIPAEDHARIFEKYATGAERERGTGLGLAFCRLAVEAHGARIRVESAAGQGATFAFSLPVAR